ncbi:succinate dehydrogenase cytochrome b560 subunit, mitochondrial-like [Uloborus diversus]|uniref:succinate dehydrogenase cytochrome b560 subunit, mitochondrial-like n=1 Tax=Uloborus diversus TaxID=327109 RepID=UPI00240A4397|nr:succinate dehydrogenase cytochrome b560 subunit, mitochondrial-like [Uloborus diversus]
MAYYLTCYRFTRPFLKNCIPALSALHSDKFVSTSSRKESETFFEKNERLKRPMSPHLTIYKPQLTSMLSITHRATGIVLSGALYTLSIGMLILPANFPYYINYLQSLHLPSALILSFKFALAWSFMYHTANGIRHLAWDMGYGFELKNLYMSGYLVVGSSVIASLLAASM